MVKLEHWGMPPNLEPLTTSVLLIDGSKTQRAYWTDQLKRCSVDYEIIEATDARSGRELYQSRRVDCVVLELALPDELGFRLLVDLVPIPNRPHVAVIVLTHMAQRGVWELAKQNGAYACFVKRHTTGEDLDRAIQRAVAFVGQTPKKDGHRPG
jgi:CheY-like chemotaxis protein